MHPLIAAALQTPDRPDLPDAPTEAPPEEIGRERRRGLVPLPVAHDPQPELTIEEARALIRTEIARYLAAPNPEHMLLIALPPGAGKTTIAVMIAEELACQLRGQVLYAVPRHNMFTDLMRQAAYPDMWQHWLPHQSGDEATGQVETCRWAKPFAAWTKHGHKGFHFCQKSSVCGFRYIAHQCVYYAQLRDVKPIVMVQHQDLVLGHPLLRRAQVIIGDESPLGAWLHDWRIPVNAIIPASVYADEERRGSPDLTLDAATLELLLTLRHLVDRPARDEEDRPAHHWGGPALLRQLGGAMHVRQVCDDALIDPAYVDVPDLPDGTPDSADQVPYAHLLPLLRLLREEAEEAIYGRDAISRVQVSGHGLRLLLRRQQPALARVPHLIWLDATANPELYRVMFGRAARVIAPRVRMAGRVHQVYAALNNRDSLVGDDTPTARRSDKRQLVADQVTQIIRRGDYRRPAIVTYQRLKELFPGYETLHFYGLRGTNTLIDSDNDALIVVGTPQPSLDALIDQAAMLYQERHQPFDRRWSDRVVPYGRSGYGYAASGFWSDPALQALLTQYRESELVQAAHRVRPLFRPIDVWLLTNLPLPDLPPRHIYSLADLFGAPPGADPLRWPEVEQLADALGAIYPDDLTRALGIQQRAAQRWIAGARRLPGWVPVERRSGRARIYGARRLTDTED